MCDFCHAGPAARHHPACPVTEPMPTPREPERDPIDDERADLRLAIRLARRAVERHPRESHAARVLAGIRRDMMRP